MNLRLDWCSYDAAKYAVMNWHYSRRMPVCKLLRIGVWENDRFIGSVIYSQGNCSRIGQPFGLPNMEICELVRVALDTHETPTTRIVAISLKLLKKHCPGIKAVVSYADQNQGHEGIIYRAGNWDYLGEIASVSGLMVNGKLRHNRALSGQFGRPAHPALRYAPKVKQKPKHKFIYWFDQDLRAKHQGDASSFSKADRVVRSQPARSKAHETKPAKAA